MMCFMLEYYTWSVNDPDSFESYCIPQAKRWCYEVCVSVY